MESNSVYAKLFELKKYMGSVAKDKVNKFTNSNYVDINSILLATEPALQEVGLIVVDEIREFVLCTKVIDPETGDSIESVASLVMVKQDPQAYMSALSYMRRANRVSLLGITQKDDDGSLASGQSFAKPAQIKRITSLIMETGTDAQAVLTRYRVEAWKDLYAANADDLIKTLEIKKNKGGKDGTNN